jgi:iron complex transport system permease protein
MKLKFLLPLILALTIFSVISLTLGSAAIAHPWRQIFHPFDFNSADHQIIWSIRAPRIAAALLVGALLGIAGTVAQASINNPLADPSIIGTTAGASLGVLIAVLLNFLTIGSVLAVGVATVGAFLATLLTYLLAKSASQLVIVGIGISAIFTSIVGLTISMISRPDARSISFWSLGSLALVTNSQILLLVAILIIVATAALLLAKNLDLLSLGDATVRHLGINSQRIRLRAFVVLSVAVAASVSTVGTISFLALAAPHIARFVVGPKNKAVIVTSALLGALILLIADTAARTIAPPHELPIGLLTSLIGAPILITALKRGAQVWR